MLTKGLCKVKFFSNIQNKLDRAHPTHPPFFVFGNPSLTWTEHSNHNNQQLLAMYIQNRQSTHRRLLQNISTGLGLFWDDFPQNKFRVRPGTTVISDFFLCQAPKLVHQASGMNLTTSERLFSL